jgi:hypothetical protein
MNQQKQEIYMMLPIIGGFSLMKPAVRLGTEAGE